MFILGLICFQGHSSAAALIKDGKVLGAVSEDRFTRKKYDTSFPLHSIQFLLNEFSLKLSEVNYIVFAWNPYESLRGNLGMIIKNFPYSLTHIFEKRPGHHELSRFKKFMMMSHLAKDFKQNFKGHIPPITYYTHHLAHSYAAIAPIDKSGSILSVVADGTGETSTVTFYEVKEGRHRILLQSLPPHSFGFLYSAITELLGFRPDSDEYRVMGLASHGENVHAAKFEKLASVDDGHIKLDLSYFSHHRSADQFISKKMLDLFPDHQTFKEKANIACSLQVFFEGLIIKAITQVCQKLTAAPTIIATSGGVFLNCLVNQRIRESKIFKHCYFSPIADDNGTAIGAALGLHFDLTSKLAPTLDRLDLGPSYRQEDVLVAIHKSGLQAVMLDDKMVTVAKKLAEGKVVGFFQGKTEFGPRSLGFRSILADPRNGKMKDIVNSKIKLRESFRPFAPSVLHEHSSKYFQHLPDEQLPYMIETTQAYDSCHHEIPAVVHRDGTSRIQTVKRSDNEKYYDLIHSFSELTKIPMLLNTSFNQNDEPVVNNPEDAIRCFLQSGLDCLVIENWLVEK